MEQRYTIGRLARAVGVAASTVRYYEKSRLLRPDGRTEANYRVYGPGALERLKFIRAAQANGFTLEGIAALLDLRDGTTAPCREVRTLIEERLADLETRVEQLRHLRTVLKSSLEICRRTADDATCRVIDTLNVASKGDRPSGGRRRSPRSQPSA